MDSLDIVELAQIVEDEYGVKLGAEDLEGSRPSVRPWTW